MMEKPNSTRFSFGAFVVFCFFLICFNRVTGSAPSFQYLGCYSDSTDLKAKTLTSDTMTLAQCAGMCQRSGYPYAGLQSMKTCYCGMVYDLVGKSSTGCNSSSCASDSPHCGGYMANDVYYSVDTSTTKSLVKISTSGSFNAARMTCVMNGGDLACPSDATTNANIITAASNDSSITKVWIGLYRKQESNTSANYYWTDETLAAYASNKASFASYWANGDTQTNPCVSLDVGSGKWSSSDCTSGLAYVCKQPPASSPADGSSNPGADDASTAGGVGTSSKRLALFIVLPLFLVCYGGSCILYCVHKIVKNCNRKKRPNMNLVEDGQKGQAPGAREKAAAAVPTYRPLSAGKQRVAVFPVCQPVTGYIPDFDIKQKLAGDPTGKKLDAGVDGPATARGVKLGMGDDPPKYIDRQEEKRARLLENASRESRMRREKDAEDGRAPSRPFTAQKRPEAPESPGEDPLAESHGSTTNLLGKDKGAPKGPGPSSDDPNNTPISEILKMKVAQKADKKRPRKIITA